MLKGSVDSWLDDSHDFDDDDDDDDDDDIIYCNDSQGSNRRESGGFSLEKAFYSARYM